MDSGVMTSDTKPVFTGMASDYISLSSVDLKTKQVRYGAGCLKQERSIANEEVWRRSILFKADPLLLPQRRNSTLFHNFTFVPDSLPQESKILSFSCPKDETFSDKSNQSFTLFPILNSSSSSCDTGIVSMHQDYFLANSGKVTMQTGVFTPSQKMELEHQALIFNYITANVPIPSNLLLPIRKAVEASRLTGFPGSLLRPSTFGLAAFHLGYSGNTDPEPERCRRTDGKKWRCSRDAVAEQKYCERHMNRGRHRSRKPVEGQSTNSVTTSKQPPPPSATVAPVTGTSMSNTLTINFSSAGSTNFSQENRTMVEKENLLTWGSHNSLCLSSGGQFMDDWQSENQLDYHSKKLHLSVSIPMATTDYISSTSSPANTCELDSIPMGLGVGSNQRKPSSVPNPWGSSMGGPLGEMLNCASSNHLPALNLMADGWDSSSRHDSSPTGVVSKTNFSSVSNSSAGSSPRADLLG